jgi:hypothetical protein
MDEELQERLREMINDASLADVLYALSNVCHGHAEVVLTHGDIATAKEWNDVSKAVAAAANKTTI